MKTKAFLTVVDVATRLNCCEDLVYAALHSGKLKSCRPGRKWLISEKQYADYVKSCETKPV